MYDWPCSLCSFPNVIIFFISHKRFGAYSSSCILLKNMEILDWLQGRWFFWIKVPVTIIYGTFSICHYITKLLLARFATLEYPEYTPVNQNVLWKMKLRNKMPSVYPTIDMQEVFINESVNFCPRQEPWDLVLLTKSWYTYLAKIKLPFPEEITFGSPLHLNKCKTMKDGLLPSAECKFSKNYFNKL